jgi:hypothetical protein
MVYQSQPLRFGWRRRLEKEEKMTIDKEILIEALEIAKNNFDYDAEFDKAEAVQKYIKQLQGGEDD